MMVLRNVQKEICQHLTIVNEKSVFVRACPRFLSLKKARTSADTLDTSPRRRRLEREGGTMATTASSLRAIKILSEKSHTSKIG